MITPSHHTRLWRALYCRFFNGTKPQEDADDVIRLLKNHSESLSNHKELLQQVSAWMHGAALLDELMSEKLDKWISEKLDKWMSENLDEWMSEKWDEWMSEKWDEWMNK